MTKALKIYKSSAGSGKTYTLVLSYLTIILKDDDPDRFKKILAITFTNKASKEMKERILSGLEKIILGKDLDFLAAYADATGLPHSVLQSKAKTLLSSILHNYSQLHVQTIDKFVHKIIRSFSRELGLTTNFELETNMDEFIKRGIAELLEQIGEDEQLTKTLLEYTRNLIENDDHHNLEFALEDQAKLLKEEASESSLQIYKDKDLSYFSEVKKQLQESIDDAHSKLIEHATGITNLLTGFDLELLKVGNSRSLGSLIKNILNKEKGLEFTDAQKRNTEKEEFYQKSKAKENPDFVSIVDGNSSFLKKVFLEMFETITELNLLLEVDKKLLSFSLLNSIRQILDKVKKENNIIFISDFNEIISQVIKNEPTPYIYEKIGNRFGHYFIDEFQDTSVLQWSNLIPLLHDSLSTENTNLIVGDAKQSIYRWRGGDASQFIDLPILNADLAEIDLIQDAFIRNSELSLLQTNYRSASSIIDFNNWFLSNLVNRLQEFPMISSVYSDVQQQKHRTEKGLVCIHLLEREKRSLQEDDEDHNPAYLEKLYEDVLECIEDKYNYGDICILVRTNSGGATVAHYLNSKGIKVTSQDSLLLGESETIKGITSLLFALNNPTDENIIQVFYHNFQSVSIIELFQNYRIPAESNFYNVGFDFERYLADYLPNFKIHFFNELSIFDRIDYLIEILNLDRTDAYIDKLRNFTFEFQSKYGHNIEHFVEHFHTNKNNISVSAPESSDAIRVMTIHKSKGLQFPIVMIPMSPFSHKKDVSWIHSEKLSSVGLDAFALRLKSDILTPELIETQQKSEELHLIDNLNLLYVALTRAEDRLYFNLTKSSEKDRGFTFPKNVDQLIAIHPKYNPDTSILRIGDRSFREDTKHISVEVKPENTSKNLTSNWRERIEISVSPKASLEDLDTLMELEWGDAIHSILSKCNSLDEVPKALQLFFLRNTEWQPYKERLSALFESFCKNETVIYLFSDAVEVLSERALITADSNEIRPDKIIRSAREIRLVDFKTGVPRSSHKMQIETYKSSLETLFSLPVQMYLIYLSEDNTIVIHV